MILFLRADDDLESFEVAENIEPNDFAPSDRAENIDFIDRPDSDLKEANEIVSPAMEPRILSRFWVIQLLFGWYLHAFGSGEVKQSSVDQLVVALVLLTDELYAESYLPFHRSAFSLDRLLLDTNEQNLFHSVFEAKQKVISDSNYSVPCQKLRRLTRNI